jgi:putative N-acetylmannosamine-6-phosphate epimerase/predicted NBD/HSP70 family sugar kinase
MSIPDVLSQLKGKLIVSCQAPEGDPFHHHECMARFAQAARDGGAAGIRANGVEDILAIRQAVDLPIVAIAKKTWTDGRILITGDFEDARKLAETGAEIVALDVTSRGQRFGAIERLARIKRELGVTVLADIATVEEAVAAAHAGADAVLSTMRGYTDETVHTTGFDPGFIEELRRAVDVPVIAEGRIGNPAEARAAIESGAWAVIVGTSITRPSAIARRFVAAIESARTGGDILAIDMGGTNTKFGVVAADGRLLAEGFTPTPAGGGPVLLAHLKSVARRLAENARAAGLTPRALGIATAGWVDPHSGHVVYATENLPGWTGTRIADELRAAVNLPVVVENDANALAAAESHFGAAHGCRDFVCVTLGTGVGGGCYTGGRLNRGAHYFANALGHIPVVLDGLPCTCGLKGCLEVYANAAALLRYAGGIFPNAEEVVAAANGGDARARAAILLYARHLAFGAASIVHLLDPEMLVVAGGIAQNNPLLLAALQSELSARLTVPDLRKLRVAVSSLGYYAGVYGAAAVAREGLADYLSAGLSRT